MPSRLPPEEDKHQKIVIPVPKPIGGESISSNLHDKSLTYNKGQTEAARKTLQEQGKTPVSNVFGVVRTNINSNNPQTPPKPAVNSKNKPEEKTVFEKGVGVPRIGLKAYLRDRVGYNPYDSGLRMTRAERAAEAEKISELARTHMLGTNISKKDVENIISNKRWGLNRQLYEKRNTPQAKEVRKEINFWKNQINPKK
jgi:hypothetical protein